MDDIDISLLEEVFNDVDKVIEDSDKPQPTFLLDVAKKETDIVFGKRNQDTFPKGVTANVGNASIIHKGDTDSSEDEDNKYFEDRQLNEYGRDLKNLLDHGSKCVTTSLKESGLNNVKKWKEDIKTALNADKKEVSHLFGSSVNNPSRDPIFGLRIINPLVSSVVLKERMVGRTSVLPSKMKEFAAQQNLKDFDWVTGGVIIAKSIKTSQKGNQYCVWNLTDLQADMKTITAFLFGSAYKELWKTSVGTVVGVLNPALMDSKESRTEATIRIDNAQRVMVFGAAKDYGVCKSKKKNGDPCSSVVNLSICEYCIYHVKTEYQKASRRTELQSSCSGRGLNALRNKVLGKNEVFYAGKSFLAVPGKKTEKQIKKDQLRLKNLSSNMPKLLSERDKEILKNLSGSRKDESVVPSTSRHAASLVKEKQSISTSNTASLGKVKKQQSICTSNGASLGKEQKSVCILKSSNSSIPAPNTQSVKETFIDLDIPISTRLKSAAKLNALKYVKQNGPLIEKPKKKTTEQIQALKRKLEVEFGERKKPKLDEEEIAKDTLDEKKRRSGITEEFVKMMNSEANNKALLQQAVSEEQEKYFQRLEIREKMENKMLSTFKVECKVVRCLTCNYKSFSASDLCKRENHPLKVVNGMKRFWKCGDCSARTVCLELVPLHSCKVCGSSKWEKASMMKEYKGPNLARDPLSIRGFEENFTGAQVSHANLNLMVPDES